MTIKGTLETFNLLDLLQMLAFNQKVGTLVLETARGPRTIFVEAGAIGFVRGDAEASRMLARVVRRTGAVDADRLERATSIGSKSGGFLGDALLSLGALDAEGLSSSWIASVEESFFDLLQTPLARFEFVENRRLAPSGAEGEPILPMRPVDGLLLDLTRKIDEWTVLREEIPEEEEIYEGVEGAAPVECDGHVPAGVAERVIPLLDGRRSVSALTAESDCDRFHVVKLLSLLVRQGAARRADTEALVGRAEERLGHGEAAAAVPLFRRALDRPDCPPAVRLRLSAALEAVGDTRGASTELDTFVATTSESRPGEAFDALARAMRLRGDDGATAARLCDLWLEHRLQLSDRLDVANDALRRLIGAASTEGRHGEAADRLSRFIDVGAAPAEDLLVLADLHAAADQPREAAEVLVRRAEAVAAGGRPAAAAPLLRRALGYDSTRADARRRLGEIEGADRRRRQRRRVGALALLVCLTVGTAAAVYFVRDGRANRANREVIERTGTAAAGAEARLSSLLAEWTERLDAAAAATGEDPTLAAAAGKLRASARETVAELDSALQSARNEIASAGPASGGAAAGELERYQALRKNMDARVDAALRDAATRAERAIADGEASYGKGRFAEARVHLVRGLNLSYDDEGRAARARQRLDRVAAYETAFAAARAPFDQAVAAGDHARAWTLGREALTTLLDSDLTRGLLLPVPVTTQPPGARVLVGGVEFPEATPCVLRYSPLGDVSVRIRAPGHVVWEGLLPAFSELRAGATAPPSLAVTLVEGPRWEVPLPSADARGPFLVEDVLLLGTDDARPLLAVRRADGRFSDVKGMESPRDRVRAMGATPLGAWSLLGHRTLSFSTSAGTWQHATVGRLERAPALSGDAVAVVDEEGTFYCLDVATGRVRWKRPLDAPPAQAPYGCALGFLVATTAGDALLLSAKDGATTVLVPRGPQAARAYPEPAGGALVLGPDAVARRLNADGSAAPLPDAGGAPSSDPWVGPEGTVWAGADGVVRHFGKGAPVRLPGAGRPAVAPVVGNRTVYTVDAQGVVRAVRLDAPETTVWSSRLKGPAAAVPVPVGDLLVLRTATSVVALER